MTQPLLPYILCGIMGSYGAYVFSRRRDLADLLQDLDSFLAERASKLERTRRGRVWSMWTQDGHPLHVDVRDTEHIIMEIEDDLLQARLLPENAPYTVSISAGCGGQITRNHVRQLADAIAQLSDGMATEPQT